MKSVSKERKVKIVSRFRLREVLSNDNLLGRIVDTILGERHRCNLSTSPKAEIAGISQRVCIELIYTDYGLELFGEPLPKLDSVKTSITRVLDALASSGRICRSIENGSYRYYPCNESISKSETTRIVRFTYKGFLSDPTNAKKVIDCIALHYSEPFRRFQIAKCLWETELKDIIFSGRKLPESASSCRDAANEMVKAMISLGIICKSQSSLGYMLADEYRSKMQSPANDVGKNDDQLVISMANLLRLDIEYSDALYNLNNIERDIVMLKEKLNLAVSERDRLNLVVNDPEHQRAKDLMKRVHEMINS